ncbi:phosphate transporter [Paraphaeosphaeria sporulosa]
MSFLGRLRKIWGRMDNSDSDAPWKTGRRDFEEIQEIVLGTVEESKLKRADRKVFPAYTIFSTNVVAPALAYLYWPEKRDGGRSLGINIATLVGTCTGMILFGHLADKFGRKRLYGVELVIVICATLGLTQASAGYDNKSMYVFPWIIFWRTLLGIGVGAEYPLSALIASEWSSTEHRGRMLAAVFLMQPVAQLAAQGVGLGALRGISAGHRPPLNPSETDRDKAAPVVDAVWRLVIGVGSAPAILAIIGRLTIPETPRYLLLERDGQAVLEGTAEVYHESMRNIFNRDSPTVLHRIDGTASARVDADQQNGSRNEANGPNPSSPRQSVRENVRTQTTGQHSGNSGENKAPKARETFPEWCGRIWNTFTQFANSPHGPILMATSTCWFLLDIAYYGLGLDQPQLISKIWRAKVASDGDLDDAKHPLDWNSNSLPHDETQPIFEVLEGNFVRALWTTGPASVLGCIVILCLVNRVPRVRFMVIMFVVLAIVFAILGGSLFSVYETSHHDVTVVFYAISLFLMNLGPNTITFMLPAELFETKNRGTCYGFAAACGKLGAIIAQVAMKYIRAGGTDKEPLAGLLLFLVPTMLLGALVAAVWIPEVQLTHSKDEGYSKFDNRSLESIAEDPIGGQTSGFRAKLRHWLLIGAR